TLPPRTGRSASRSRASSASSSPAGRPSSGSAPGVAGAPGVVGTSVVSGASGVSGRASDDIALVPRCFSGGGGTPGTGGTRRGAAGADGSSGGLGGQPDRGGDEPAHMGAEPGQFGRVVHAVPHALGVEDAPGAEPVAAPDDRPDDVLDVDVVGHDLAGGGRDHLQQRPDVVLL